MKLKISSLIIACLSIASANAASVLGITFDFSGPPTVVSGVTLGGVNVNVTQGITASTGYFNSTFNVTTAVDNSDWAGILANFNIVSTAIVGGTAGLYGENYAGLYDTGQGPLTATAGSPAIGQNLFTLFGTGLNVLGLVDSGQVVAVDGFPPTDYTLYPATGTVLVGSIGTSTFSAENLGITDQTATALQLIPEPSVALLGAFGVIGLLRRRR